jgi:hypothetical protein
MSHPNYHFAHGPDEDPCLFDLAPNSFNPLTASQEELAEWGLPRRPSVPDRNAKTVNYEAKMALWRKTVSGLMDPRRHQTKSYQCTRNEADFKGPKAMWTACGTADGLGEPYGIIQRAPAKPL